MSVRIRMKKMGKRHQPFFRICAIDRRAPRDGRVIEELGHYDPMCPDTDARAILNAERIDYWISVGAEPSRKVSTLIKKYGTDGTHLEQQREALEKLSQKAKFTPASVPKPKPKEEPAAEAPAEAEAPAAEAPAAEAPADEAPADEAPADEAPAAEAEAPAAEEPKAEEAAAEESTDSEEEKKEESSE